MKKKVLIFLAILLLPITVFAKSKTSCDYTLNSKLKQYASNINIVYDYAISDNTAYFSVTINNLTSDMYVIDKTTEARYDYKDTNNGELIIPGYSNVEKLKYEIYSANAACKDVLLISQYISLPVYNKYSSDPLCDGVTDFPLCYRFLKINMTYDEFKYHVTKYKNKKPEEIQKKEKKKNVLNETLWDQIVEFMLHYGVIIVAVIAILLTIISIRKSRKNRFDFKL